MYLYPPSYTIFIFRILFAECFFEIVLFERDEHPLHDNNKQQWRYEGTQASAKQSDADQNGCHAQVHWMTADPKRPVDQKRRGFLVWFDGRVRFFEK